MSTRLGLALGIVLATATAVWWLGASRVAIQSGGDTARLAAQALFILGVLRAMLIAVSAPRVAAGDGGYTAGVRSAIPIVTTAWPVVAIAWTASADSVARAVLVEVALLGGALAAPVVGHMLARWRRDRASTVPLATLAGVALACCVWLLSVHWRELAGWAHA
jgi:hypothetical protein